MKSIILVLAAGVALGASSYTHAEAAKPRPGAQQASVQAKLLDPNDTIILMLDHQTGLFQTVKDISLQAVLDRMTQAGIIQVTTNVVVTEVQRTCARPDAAKYAELYSDFAPHYRAAIEGYNKAQEAARAAAGATAAGGATAVEVEGLFFIVDPDTGNTILAP